MGIKICQCSKSHSPTSSLQGCIPVIVSDNILPYAEVLDWTLASVMCLSCDLDQLMAKLGRVSADMLDDWRTQVLFLYQRYFISMTAITLTTLDIINDRVFPMSAKSSDVSCSVYNSLFFLSGKVTILLAPSPSPLLPPSSLP